MYRVLRFCVWMLGFIRLPVQAIQMSNNVNNDVEIGIAVGLEGHEDFVNRLMMWMLKCISVFAIHLPDPPSRLGRFRALPDSLGVWGIKLRFRGIGFRSSRRVLVYYGI